MKEQPRPISEMAMTPATSSNIDSEGLDSLLSSVLARWRRKVTTKAGWVGTYSYSWLCTPTLPVYHPERNAGRKRIRRSPPFFALNEDIPIFLAVVCGLQHALAMLAGLITPPILFGQALMVDGGTQVGAPTANMQKEMLISR